MRKDHFQLYDSLRGLGLSFAITIAVGLFVAFILRDGTSVDLPLIGIASAMCLAITFISFLIWALVNGIHSHQFLRLYHLGGLSRKESFRRVWLYAFAAFLFAGLFMAVVASPLSFAVDDPHSVLIMPVAFLGTVIAGLLVNAIGQLESDIYRDTGIRPDVYELYEDAPDGSRKRVLVIEVPSRPVGKVFKFEDVPLMRVGEELKPMDDKTYLSIIQEQEPDFSELICPECLLRIWTRLPLTS